MSQKQKMEDRIKTILDNFYVEEIMSMVEELKNSNGVFDDKSLVRKAITNFYNNGNESIFHLHIMLLQQDLLFIMHRFVENLQNNSKLN